MGLLDEQYLKAVTANPNLMRQGILSRTKPPMQMKELTPQGLLDGAALATSPIPILGDIVGLGADANRYINDPSSRTWGNFGLTALGALPFVPPAAAIFAGPLAKTAKLDKKALAEGMDAAGRSREDIWKETGWFKGPEGKWKFEIDDSGSKLNPLLESGDVSSWSFKDGINAQEMMAHDKLYSAYPDLAKMNTQGRVTSEMSSFMDSLSGNSANGVLGGLSDRGLVMNSPLNQARSTATHELQHGVQNLEGFARGGSRSEMATEYAGAYRKYDFDTSLSALARTAVEDFGGSVDHAAKELRKLGFDITDDHVAELMRVGERAAIKRGEDAEKMLKQYGRQGSPKGDVGMDLYRRLAGEAEARAVQARMNMSPLQRQQTPPWQSYDVPWDRLIIK